MPPDTKKQKPLLVIISMYMVLLIAIVAGIYFLKASHTPPKEPVACQYDPDVCLFLATVQNPKKYYSGSFTANILITKADNTQSRVIISSDPVGNLELISYNENTFTGQSLIFGKTMYIKSIKTNTWTKSQTPPYLMLSDFKQKALTEVAKSGTNVSYQFLGESPCGKDSCIKYHVITPPSGKIKTYVLFDKNSHLLKEMISQTPQHFTTDTLFFLTPVNITPPPLP